MAGLVGVAAAPGPDESEDFCHLALEIRPDGSHWANDPNNGCRATQVHPSTTQG